jgi:hypothetical protein
MVLSWQVERALLQWSTGIYDPYDEYGRPTNFSGDEWKHATDEFMISIEKLSEAVWTQILTKAAKYAGLYRKRGRLAASIANRHIYGASGRAMCYIEETEQGEGRASDEAEDNEAQGDEVDFY